MPAWLGFPQRPLHPFLRRARFRLLGLLSNSFDVSKGTATVVVTATQIVYALGLALLIPLGDLLENRRLASRTLLITAVELATGQCGWVLASLARQLRPNIPVLYLTSYSEAAWAIRGVSGSKLIQKPSEPAAVVSQVDVLLRQGTVCTG